MRRAGDSRHRTLLATLFLATLFRGLATALEPAHVARWGELDEVVLERVRAQRLVDLGGAARVDPNEHLALKRASDCRGNLDELLRGHWQPVQLGKHDLGHGRRELREGAHDRLVDLR